MAEIKQVGINKVRDLKEGEVICCEHCGECETKMVQNYTRKVTDREDNEIVQLHYIDQEVCVNCEDKSDLVVWNELTDEEAEGDVYVYTDLTIEVGNVKDEGGKIAASFSGDPMHIFADAMISQFKDTGATNFLEMTFGDDHSDDEYILCLQKKSGTTPGQQLDTLKAKVSKGIETAQFYMNNSGDKGTLKFGYSRVIEVLKGDK